MQSTLSSSSSKSSTLYTFIIIISICLLVFVGLSFSKFGDSPKISSSSSLNSKHSDVHDMKIHEDEFDTMIINHKKFSSLISRVNNNDTPSDHDRKAPSSTSSSLLHHHHHHHHHQQHPCPEPFFYPVEAVAGISNQRENWLNHLLLANALGFQTIVIPSSCPIGYVSSHQQSQHQNKKYSPPFDKLSNEVKCGPFELLMDVDRYKKMAQKMGLCVIDPHRDLHRYFSEFKVPPLPKIINSENLQQEDSADPDLLSKKLLLKKLKGKAATTTSFLKTDLKIMTLPIKDWLSAPEISERKRLVYSSNDITSGGILQRQVEEVKKIFSEKQRRSLTFLESWFAIRPRVPLTTVFYTRYYDRCDAFCYCNDIVRLALRPNRFIRSIVRAVVKVLRGEKRAEDFEWNNNNPALGLSMKQKATKSIDDKDSHETASSSSSKLNVLHFRIFHCKFITILDTFNIKEEILKHLSKTDKASEDEVVETKNNIEGNSTSSSFTAKLNPKKSTNSKKKKRLLYMASELKATDPKHAFLDSLRLDFQLIQKEDIFPELFDFPFEARSLIDYEIALQSDTFFGFPGGSSFTHFAFTQRRAELLSRVGVKNRKALDEEFSSRNVMVQSFKEACPAQTRKVSWDGVPVSKYLDENKEKKNGRVCLLNGEKVVMK